MAPRRRILLIIGSMREGGSENQVVLLMRGLRARGHDVGLMLLHYEGVRLQELLADGFQVFDVKLPRFRPKWSPMPWLKMPLTILRSVRFIRIWQPDVFHAWLFWAHFWARICLFFLPAFPLVTSRRQTAHAGRLLQIENWNNRRAAAVVANSDAVMKSVRILEKNLPECLVIIPNGIDLQHIDQLPAENIRAEFPALREAALVGACVANLLPVKDYPNLLRAWKQVRESAPGAKLLCIGADGGELGRLEKLRAELGLEEHVVFAGSRRDPARYIKAADFGVLASSDEGLSNAMLEYMACGKAPILTDVSGAREAVVDGESGLIVPAGNSSALAGALLRVIQDEDIRRRLGENARRRLEEKFNYDVMVQKHEELYEELIAAYSRSSSR